MLSLCLFNDVYIVYIFHGKVATSRDIHVPFIVNYAFSIIKSVFLINSASLNVMVKAYNVLQLYFFEIVMLHGVFLH